jgi:hypothetical protein
MDYAFKINVLARELERGVLPPIYNDNDGGGLDVSGSGSDSDSGASSAATTSA